MIHMISVFNFASDKTPFVKLIYVYIDLLKIGVLLHLTKKTLSLRLSVNGNLRKLEVS